jgi:beta-N-acetylhexosaminidase
MGASLVIDIEGQTLTAADRALLSHPAVGGVILFSRNYQDKTQITSLITDIKQIQRPKPLFVCVDQEGGRVQRFKTDFIPLPSAKAIGQVYDKDSAAGLAFAKAVGFCLAAELIGCGVDFSFTPVLDVDYRLSEVIGNRSFHQDPEVIIALSAALMKGLDEAGMTAVGKHFPGHGGVRADSHLALPVDTRPYAEIQSADLRIFEILIQRHQLPTLMTAHMIVDAVDSLPVTFSSHWLKRILRDTLNFTGLIFSDDLSMQGAAIYPTMHERVEKALLAGCDYVLICNDRAAVLSVLDMPLLLSHTPSHAALFARETVGMAAKFRNYLEQCCVYSSDIAAAMSEREHV